MPRIMIVGDIHTHFNRLKQLAKKHRVDHILSVGDTGFWRPDDTREKCRHRSRHDFVDDLPDRFPFAMDTCYGNHDNIEVVKEIQSGKHPAASWVRIPRPGEIIEAFGYRITALNGNYSTRRFDWTREKVEQGPQGKNCFYVREDIERILNTEFDILLSHEGALGTGLVKEYTKQEMGREEIREILEKKQPLFAFSGHHHCFRQSRVGRTQTYTVPLPSQGCLILEDGKVTPHLHLEL